MSDYVRTLLSGDVLEVVICRPPANAIDYQMSCELYAAFRDLNDNDHLRVGILRADPNPKKIFCAGWDLKAFARGEGRDDEGGFALGPGGIGGLPEFWDLYKPVIAAVDGLTAGGGFEMVLGADVIIASDDSAFFLPEMQRGFIPDGGAIQRLHHRIPYNVAADLVLTGRRMSAAEGNRWGLIRDVVPAAEVTDKAREVARIIADGAPLVSRALKEFWRFNAHLSPEQAQAQTHLAWERKSNMPHYEKMLDSDDFDEGAVAFTEKRPPRFSGK